jgi:ferric-dicitrate binding protein FerR (iron transport regulator)
MRNREGDFRARRARRVTAGAFVWRAGLAAAGLVLAAQALAADCALVAARVVSAQGTVELRRAQSTQWSAAAVDAELCPGDSLRVGERSRAALRLANDSSLRLDQLTTLTLSATQERASLIELLRGAINVITRTPKPFEVRTPFLNAGVEGTEFLVRVDADSAQVAVFEGKVSVANSRGTIALASGEVAFAAGDAPPRRERVVRPAQAVQWALYYPSIIGAGSTEEAPLREADALVRGGRISEAFGRLDAVPAEARSSRHAAYRAELLLLVGRVDDARTEIARALTLDARSSDAYALQSVIAVVQNEGAEALRLARTAVELDPRAATARMALSYAEQARFDIAAALASAEQAAALAPSDALVWARVAELRMASGDLGAALTAAQRASGLEPALSRTQTVLGFAYLTRIETAAARQSFGRAIALDASDPLPHLGLGLARIREGELAGGREEIEIAASLDPLNSLVRSYLGKAYYEERRDRLAGEQFDIAKSNDPNDPTPYFYDSILKYSQNRPIESIELSERALDLNGNRAVVRSRLLLDNDAAYRAATLASTLGKAGFTELATGRAFQAWAADPSSPYGHRFLADAYVNRPRHEQARASELLQAQFLEDQRVVRRDPLAIDDRTGPKVRLFSDSGFRQGYQEYASTFDTKPVDVSVDALVASARTLAERVAFDAAVGAHAVGLSQFRYRTDGSEANSDVARTIVQATLKSRPTYTTMLFVDLVHIRSDRGDTLFGFDPNAVEQRRFTEHSNGVLVGMHVRLGQTSDLLLLGMRQQRETTNPLLEEAGPPVNREAARLTEVQYILHEQDVGLIAGISWLRSDVETLGQQGTQSDREHKSAYALGTLRPWRRVLVSFGAAFDEVTSNNMMQRRRASPRFGLTWNATDDTLIRVADLSSVKRRLIANQTLEPTQIAGFNQYYDDVSGTIARRIGVGLDQKLLSHTYAGFEVSQRRLTVPLEVIGGVQDYEWREKLAKAYAYTALPARTTRALAPDWSFTAGLEFERENFARPEDLTGTESILDMSTRVTPLWIRGFQPSGMSFRVGQTWVRQKGNLQFFPGFNRFARDERFSVTDFELTLPLAQKGAFVIGSRNIFNRTFSYFDTDPAFKRFVPGRYVFARLSLQL